MHTKPRNFHRFLDTAHRTAQPSGHQHLCVGSHSVKTKRHKYQVFSICYSNFIKRLQLLSDLWKQLLTSLLSNDNCKNQQYAAFTTARDYCVMLHYCWSDFVRKLHTYQQRQWSLANVLWTFNKFLLICVPVFYLLGYFLGSLLLSISLRNDYSRR